jgi:hypothetical protein
MRETEKGPDTRPRWRKWLRRFFLAFLSLVLFLLLGGVGFRLYYSDSRLREMAERFAGERIGGEVKIGDLDLALFSSVRVEDVSVQDEGEEILSLGSGRIRYDWLSFLRNRPVIDEIRLVNARLLMPPGPEERPARPELPIRLPGIFPAARPSVTAETPEDTPFTVKRFVLQDVEIVFPAGKEDRRVRLEGISADWQVSGTAPDIVNAAGTVSARGGEWSRGDDPPVEIPPLDGDFSLAFDARRRGATVEIRSFNAGEFAVTGSLSLQEPAAGPAVAELSLDLSGSLERLPKRLVPLPGRGLGGELTLSAVLSGPPDRLAGRVEVTLRDSRIGSGDTVIRAERVSMEEWVSVRNLDRVEAGGELEIEGILIPGLSGISRIRVPHDVAAGIRAATFSIREAAFAASGGTVRVSGGLTGEATGARALDFDARGEGRLEKILQVIFPVSPRQVFGEVEFEAKVSGPPASPKVAASAVSGLVQYSDSAVPDRRVFLRNVSVRTSAGPVSGGTIPVLLTARMEPTVAETGRETVRVGVVDATGEGSLNIPEGVIRFRELKMAAPGLTVSSTAELRFQPGGEAKSGGALPAWTGPAVGSILPVEAGQGRGGSERSSPPDSRGIY